MTGRKRVLFLCTGNMCRSQMAEGILRHLAPDRYEAFSAGWRPAPHVHPFAVTVMGEIGIDIGAQRAKGLEAFLPPSGTAPDAVVTLCEMARKKCPVVPGGAPRIHWPTFDPILAEGNEELRLSVFRAVRDELRARIEMEIGGAGFEGGREAREIGRASCRERVS